MAYFLRTDGIDDYVNLASPITISANEPFEIIIDCTLPNDNLTARFFGDIGGGLANRFLAYNNGAGTRFELRLSDNVARVFDISVNYLTLTTGDHIYRVVRNSSNQITVFIDNTQIGGAVTANDAMSVKNLFTQIQPTQARRAADYRTVKFLKNGILAHNYDPSASNGTGTTLIDTVGGNNGTLVNFPTDNSQWVFYESGGGGGEYSATISSTTFLPTSLVSATNTKPEYNASINSTTLLPLSSIAAESTRPQYSATIASNTLLPTSTVLLDSETPAYSVSIVGSTLLPTSSVGLDSETPQNSIIVNSTTLLPIGTVQLSDIKPEYVLSVSSSTLLPIGSIELDSVVPEYSLDISSSTKLPTSIVVLINGEIINYTNPKNIVSLTYRKGVSKLTVSNNNIKPIYSNNIIKLRN